MRTDAVEALDSKIRRAPRTRGPFPGDDAAAKLIYLALNATSKQWKRPVRDWHALKSQLAIMFEGRFPMTQENTSRTKLATIPQGIVAKFGVHLSFCRQAGIHNRQGSG